MAKKVSKFFRIGVEGDTIDGREIGAADIQQMAATCSTKVYGARINMEHIKGILPDGYFRRYGGVVELKAEKIDEPGEPLLHGKWALYASLAPTADLVSMVGAGQKVFTSMEIRRDFAKTGKAYLVGLAGPVITGFSLLMGPTLGLTKGLFKLSRVAAKFSFKGITTAARGLGSVMKFTGGAVGRSLLTMGGGMLKLMSIVGRVSFAGLVKGLRFVGTAVMWLGRIMMANPILAVVSLIAMAAVYIWQNWETLGPKFQAAWETIKNATLSAWNSISTATSEAWENVKKSTQAAWQNLKTWLGGQWDDLVGSAKALPGKFKEAGMNMINGIMDGISERWQVLKDKISGLTDMLPDWMKFGGKTEVNPAISYSRPAPELTPGPGYAGAFDKGGDIPSGQFGIVGEHGPEIVNGPANITGRRKTAALSAAMLSLSTPVMAAAPPAAPVQITPAPITIEVHAAPGQDAQAIAREVSRQLAAEQRKQAAAARSRMNYGG